MSLKYRDVTGKETPIAGLNGLSGELVPSVSYYQSGTTGNVAVGSTAAQEVNVTFDSPMPDTDYEISFSFVIALAYLTIGFANKTTTGFTLIITNVHNTANQTVNVKWQAFKLMTDESRALDEQAIATNTADIAALKTSVASLQPTRYRVSISAQHTVTLARYSTTELFGQVAGIGQVHLNIVENGGIIVVSDLMRHEQTVLTAADEICYAKTPNTSGTSSGEKLFKVDTLSTGAGVNSTITFGLKVNVDVISIRTLFA